MLSIDQVKARFDGIAAYGKTPEGGYSRLAMSDEDMAARQALTDLLIELGLAPFTDNAGCLWAIKTGLEPDLPPVLMGSHIDTVYNGGAYDGLLGVMAGYEVLHHLVTYQIPHKRSIGLLVLSTEESSRFNCATAGSKLLSGRISAAQIKTYTDATGLSLYDAMKSRGFDLESLNTETARLKAADSFFELHIEQGPYLEANNLRIGVVEAIAAPTRIHIEMLGDAAHSGACPMELRKDALAAASRVVLAVEEIGRRESIHRSVATVTKLDIPGQSLNVVPGRVSLWVDIRGIHTDSIARCVADLEAVLPSIAQLCKVDYSLQKVSADQPVALDSALALLVEQQAEKLGLSFMRMPSGAGHDAMNIAYCIPSALIFVPCKGGVSHNKAESITDTALSDGITLLYHAVLERASR